MSKIFQRMPWWLDAAIGLAVLGVLSVTLAVGAITIIKWGISL